MAKKQGAAHSRTRGSLGMPAALTAGAVLAAAAAGGALVATHQQGKNRAKATLISTKGTTARGAHAHTHHKLGPILPLSVVSITPAASARAVAWLAPITVHYSQPLASSSPLPSISPPVAGSWDRVSSTTLQFRPADRFLPYAKETVVVPATTRSSRGVALGKTVTSSFSVTGASLLRLQELLAELGYLPLSFTPSGGGASATATTTTAAPSSVNALPPPPTGLATAVLSAPGPTPTVDSEASTPGQIPLEPLPGVFRWRFSNIPASLSSLWQTGQSNVITTGAVMAFEQAHGLTTDGVPGPAVWKALLGAVAAKQVSTAPYDYVYVSMGSPEYVTVWRDGVDVFETLANTGIPQAPTAPGTFPVYLRYRVTTMSGTNPDGTPYSDPGIPFTSYFNGGDALHGFIRSSYGFPQSLGCVEMPFSSAGVVWPYTPIGTLVTIP